MSDHVAANEAKQEGKKFPIIEIFGPTIQGEGPVIGYQTIFIRFGGCDFKCQKCDSLHAVIPSEVQKNATYLTAQEIFMALADLCDKTGCRWVTLSGGNPLIHDMTELVYNLKRSGIKTTVETQGSYFRPWISLCDQIVISPKSPGMGEKFVMSDFVKFLDYLTHHPNTAVKIVCFSNADLEFALSVFSIDHQFFYMPGGWPPRKYISLGNEMPPNLQEAGTQERGGFRQRPEFSYEKLLRDYNIMIEEILQDRRLKDVIVLPQLHVMLWGNKQGV